MKILCIFVLLSIFYTPLTFAFSFDDPVSANCSTRDNFRGSMTDPLNYEGNYIAYDGCFWKATGNIGEPMGFEGHVIVIADWVHYSPPQEPVPDPIPEPEPSVPDRPTAAECAQRPSMAGEFSNVKTYCPSTYKNDTCEARMVYEGCAYKATSVVCSSPTQCRGRWQSTGPTTSDDPAAIPYAPSATDSSLNNQISMNKHLENIDNKSNATYDYLIQQQRGYLNDISSQTKSSYSEINAFKVLYGKNFTELLNKLDSGSSGTSGGGQYSYENYTQLRDINSGVADLYRQGEKKEALDTDYQKSVLSKLDALIIKPAVTIDAEDGSISSPFSFDYEKNASTIKSALTENVSEGEVSALGAQYTDFIDEASSSYSISTLKVTDSAQALIDGQSSVASEYSAASDYMTKLGEGSDSALTNPFMSTSLLPQFPKPSQCGAFVVFKGSPYEGVIEVKYLTELKLIFGYVLYAYTFISAYKMFTNIGKGEE